MRILVRIVLGGLGLLVLGLLLGLAWTHSEIRRIEPPMPSAKALVQSAAAAGDLPIRVHVLNTASQRTTRAGVLEPSLDPDPDAPYTMSVPAFAIEWPDGRLFLIDLGMDGPAAEAFGRPSELLFDADPMQSKGNVVDQLGSRVSRVAGVAFTHLHTDHTNGALVLCAQGERQIPLYQGRLQSEQLNYTTRPGADHLEAAGCLDPQPLGFEGLLAVPGFEGLFLVPVAGHTPGSQIFVAHMAAEAPVRTWIFTGDAVNHVDGVRLNLPKPTLYSLLVVPENPRQLEAVRLLLREASQQPGVRLLVAHDQNQLEASGASLWPDRHPTR